MKVIHRKEEGIINEEHNTANMVDIFVGALEIIDTDTIKRIERYIERDFIVEISSLKLNGDVKIEYGHNTISELYGSWDNKKGVFKFDIVDFLNDRNDQIQKNIDIEKSERRVLDICYHNVENDDIDYSDVVELLTQKKV